MKRMKNPLDKWRRFEHRLRDEREQDPSTMPSRLVAISLRIQLWCLILPGLGDSEWITVSSWSIVARSYPVIFRIGS
jgi:hypothetical protein